MPLDQPDSPADDAPDSAMPLGDHLEELRRRLIWMFVGLVVAAAITFPLGFRIIAWLAQPMLQAQDAMGFPPQTITTDPTAGFTSVFLPVTLIAALLLAFPWIIYQAWGFVAVGLYKHERTALYLLTPFSTLMTVLGVSFTYYVLLPVSLMFFLSFATYYPPVDVGEPNWVMRQLLRGYAESPMMMDQPVSPGPAASLEIPVFPVLGADPLDPAEGSVWINRAEGKIKAVVAGRVRVVGLQLDQLIAPMPQLGEYVSFAAMMMLGVVAAFQVPVVMLVVGWTGLFDPDTVAGLRKYAVFFAFLVGGILTPTDLSSMFVLAIPLYVLFELGLLLMRWAQRTPPPPDDL